MMTHHAPSLHGKISEIGAKEVKIKVSMPLINVVRNNDVLHDT